MVVEIQLKPALALDVPITKWVLCCSQLGSVLPYVYVPLSVLQSPCTASISFYITLCGDVVRSTLYSVSTQCCSAYFVHNMFSMCVRTLHTRYVRYTC